MKYTFCLARLEKKLASLHPQVIKNVLESYYCPWKKLLHGKKYSWYVFCLNYKTLILKYTSSIKFSQVDRTLGKCFIHNERWKAIILSPHSHDRNLYYLVKLQPASNTNDETWSKCHLTDWSLARKCAL